MTDKNPYELEELLPIVAKLASEYTSFESSSVPYETAQMLLAAVDYCIRECREDEVISKEKEVEKEVEKDKWLLATKEPMDALTAYERGYKLVLNKAKRARQVYEELVAEGNQGFEDYGCINYRDTLLGGIPKFFLYYDARFQPQNHILTLDYPTLISRHDMCGIDRIYQYLIDIQKEKEFLDCFEPYVIRRLLAETHMDYEELYLDNICELVLWKAIECVIADCAIYELEVGKRDEIAVMQYFASDSKQQTKQKLAGMIRFIIKGLVGADTLSDYEMEYFEKLSAVYASIKLKKS